MAFKTRPHRYSFSLSPGNRACCRGCNAVVKRGTLRLVTHAFVKPGLATQLVRHAKWDCIGKALADDVRRASKTQGRLTVHSDLGWAGVEEACRILQSAADGQPTSVAEVKVEHGKSDQPTIEQCWGKLVGNVRKSFVNM